MRKICHLTSAHPSNDVRVFHRECSSLAKAGYDVYLIAKGESRIENNVKVVGLGEQVRGRIYRMLKFSKQVYQKGLEVDADVYHIHDPEMLPYALKLKKLGKRVIFDSHENYSMQLASREYLPAIAKKIIGKIYHKYESYVVKRIDAVIVPCTFNGNNIFEHKAKKTVFIANYPPLGDIERYTDNSIKKEPRSFCYAGSIRYANGLTNAINVVARTGAKFLLAGKFSSEDYKKELESMPGYNNVKYYGMIQYSDVMKLYQSSQVGYYVELPIGQNSAVDTFGMKIYEYMSLGLPIVVNDSRYARRVIDKYKCGIYVDPYNVDEISSALTYLFENPNVAFEMGCNGKKAVMNDFNWETQEKKLFELYSYLV